MPTGYTAPLYEGQTIDFRTFVLRCARAFGATVTLREEPLAPVPSGLKLEPSTYHREALAQARADRDALLRHDLPTLATLAHADYEKACASNRKHLDEKAALKARYDAMLTQVHAWKPPTTEHYELKSFMVEQIKQSIDFDCDTSYYPAPNPDDFKPEVWLRKQIDSADWSVKHHEEEWAKEVERTTGRNQWIADLFASLEPAE